MERAHYTSICPELGPASYCRIKKMRVLHKPTARESPGEEERERNCALAQLICLRKEGLRPGGLGSDEQQLGSCCLLLRLLLFFFFGEFSGFRAIFLIAFRVPRRFSFGE